ncbi:DUF4190 domain-containing protein [Streptomyces sp. CAU 1734]|uniref:DUF4190 domain-containing protein n=1 Tax=Streptomyces sp. CAU 1734 TaxID=3140360 RepID=UPI0032617AB2
MDPTQPGGPEPHGRQPDQSQPQQHPAYQAYQQFPGYPVPPPKVPVNGLSIASLVTGIVCCGPPIGLILGVVALRQIKRKGQRGRGMAIAGIAVSAVSTLLLTLFLVSGAAGDAWDEFEKNVDEVASTRFVEDLDKGDCYNVPGKGTGAAETVDIQIVDCAKKHEAEVTGTFTITGFDKYPGTAEVESISEKRCAVISDAYSLDSWDIPADIEYYDYLPTREGWALGDRQVTCGFAMTDGRPTTGSVRKDATTLDTHQLLFLQAEAAADGTAILQPEDEDFDANKKKFQSWARDSSEVYAEHAAALKAHKWPTAAAAAAGRRAEEFRGMSDHLDKAARAKDGDIFWTNVADGYELLRDSTAIAVRGPLDLVTVPPEESADAA